jgi:hypothetical protein
MSNKSIVLFSWFIVLSICPEPNQLLAQTPTTQSDNRQPIDNGSNSDRKYLQAATDQVNQYLSKYPDLKLYPPKVLVSNYPPGIQCGKVKQLPFIVMMLVSAKARKGEVPTMAGSGISPIPENKKPSINGDVATLSKQDLDLMNRAVAEGWNDAIEVDKKRPRADQGRHVLYQYRVQFDPATCKNEAVDR